MTRGGLVTAAWLAANAVLPIAKCNAQHDSPVYVHDSQIPLGVGSFGAVPNNTIANCHRACDQLASSGAADLTAHYPSLPSGFSSLYFSSQQGSLVPLCLVQPLSVDAVSAVVQTVREHSCPFAIKSGGHATANGTSNLNDGLLLDLGKLDHIRVSDDKQTVSVGPGNSWGKVYKVLEPYELGVVGGRVSDVGVGGFIMGGGLSAISPKYGWAFDNVHNFELVLPNGTIANVNETSHPDLLFALRGGNANFGVVTRFDLKVYPQGLVWGGTNLGLPSDIVEREVALGVKAHLSGWNFGTLTMTLANWVKKAALAFGYGTKSTDIIGAFADLGHAEDPDVSAQAFLCLTWVPYLKTYIYGLTYLYSEQVEHPAALKNLTSFPGIQKTGKLAFQGDFAQAISDMNLFEWRNEWFTATFKLDKDFISMLWDIIYQESDFFRLDQPNAFVSSNIQLLTTKQIAHDQKNGGNAFGLSLDDGPLILFSMTIIYKEPEYDEAARALGHKIHDRAETLGKELGLHHPWLYPNYAHSDQNIFSGFPPANLQRLLDLQQIYDPGRVFANLLPKHYRLGK
ncbi:hypothetical protein BX600DRAFT_31580 [Xylariales sp. PMI_506]|nr:hypothetical protein BX600DRAFT_31580 [Xylariales sp. PMI_506]